MSNLDVEALIEEPFKAPSASASKHNDRNGSSRSPGGRSKEGSERGDRSVRARDYDRDDARSTTSDSRRRRRSRSRDSDRDRNRSRRDRDDYYDRSRYSRDRDRDDRHYRRRDYDRDDRDRYRDDRRRSRSPRRERSERSRSAREHTPTEDERDRRTVFVQQLAARLRTKELIAFFEKVGPVKEAQIVKDKVSGRSKGVGYVEFKDEASVPKAIQLTGQRLLGIPIIAQLTEAEKNRQARAETNASQSSAIPFHRLYVGNIHFSITEEDLSDLFKPWGDLEFVQLQKDESGRSKGYGFVQYRDPAQAREALERMNGFDLAGRQIRVGLGNDKFTPESTAQMLQRFSGYQGFQGSAFESRGRGTDRLGRADEKASGGGASALDDTDVAGVNFNNYSRDLLMRKLAREDDGSANQKGTDKPRPLEKAMPKPAPVNVTMASRCVVLKNMFDPAEETGDNWVKELEEDVKAECEEKYGKVVHIAVDPNSQGEIYVKFDRISGGEKAILGLNGRFFGGRRISASPVVDAVYSSLFARTKAM